MSGPLAAAPAPVAFVGGPTGGWAVERIEALADELRTALPQMQADFASINGSIADARAAIDAALRATGARA